MAGAVQKAFQAVQCGADHIRPMMEDSDVSSIEACMRNEPVRDELMTLSGPIRAERHIPPPLPESPVCLREFRFPATTTQSGTTLGQLSTQSPQAPGSISNLVTAHSWSLPIERREQTYDLITESQYKDLPSFIGKLVSLSELNTNLTRFRKIAQESGPDSREVDN